MQKEFSAGIPGGDEVQVQVTFSQDGQITKSQWKVVGSLDLIERARTLQAGLRGPVMAIAPPSGTTFSELLLKELILKIKGEWPEEPEPELCHCRNVPQKIVERAILLGAHTVEKVRQRTSANTGCGTCLPEVERLLKLYLK